MIVKRHFTQATQNIIRTVYDIVQAIAVCQSPGQVQFMTRMCKEQLVMFRGAILDLGDQMYLRNNPQTLELATNTIKKLNQLPSQNLSQSAREDIARCVTILGEIQEYAKR